MKCFQIVGNDVIPGLPITTGANRPFVRLGRYGKSGYWTNGGWFESFGGGSIPLNLSDAVIANPGNSIKLDRLLEADLKCDSDGSDSDESYILDRSSDAVQQGVLVNIGFDGTDARYDWHYTNSPSARAHATHHLAISGRYYYSLGLFILAEMQPGDEIEVHGSYRQRVPGTSWWRFRYERVDKTRAKIRFNGTRLEVTYVE